MRNEEKVLKLYSVFIEAETSGQYGVVDDFLDDCILQYNLTRREMYDFIFHDFAKYIKSIEYKGLSDNSLDYLHDIEMSIIGFCSADTIMKFSNEPQNSEELSSYVRSNIWKSS